jgi:hypothetical protein
VCPPPAPKAGGAHSLGGGGVPIEKKPSTLPTLWPYPSLSLYSPCMGSTGPAEYYSTFPLSAPHTEEPRKEGTIYYKIFTVFKRTDTE